jgi:hypothetical protein
MNYELLWITVFVVAPYHKSDRGFLGWLFEAMASLPSK